MPLPAARAAVSVHAARVAVEVTHGASHLLEVEGAKVVAAPHAAVVELEQVGIKARPGRAGVRAEQLVHAAVVLFDDEHFLGHGMVELVTVSDQAAFDLGKSVAEVLSATDVFSMAVMFDGILFGDIAAPADQIPRFAVGKNLAEVLTATDLITTVTLDLTKADSVTAVDVRAVDFVPGAFADAVSATDARSTDIGKSLADSATAAEAIAFSYSKALTDSVTPADALAFDLGKSLADSVTPTEAGGVTGDFIRGAIAELVTASDAIAIAFGQSLADAASADDAISITDFYYRELNEYELDSVEFN